MGGNRKQAIKKYLKDYAMAIVGTFLLVVALLTLVTFRYTSLASISDISKINPLITSEQNELVASRDSTGVLTISQKDKKGTDDSDKKDDTSTDSQKDDTKSSSGSSSGGSSSGSSGGGSSGDSGNGGDDGGSSGGGTPPPPPPPFSVTIGDDVIQNTTPTKNCRATYEFTFTILGENAPGDVHYRWKRDDGDWTNIESKHFLQGETNQQVVHGNWSLGRGKVGGHTIRLQTLTPNQHTKVYNFNHSCQLFVL